LIRCRPALGYESKIPDSNQLRSTPTLVELRQSQAPSLVCSKIQKFLPCYTFSLKEITIAGWSFPWLYAMPACFSRLFALLKNLPDISFSHRFFLPYPPALELRQYLGITG